MPLMECRYAHNNDAAHSTASIHALLARNVVHHGCSQKYLLWYEYSFPSWLFPLVKSLKGSHLNFSVYYITAPAVLPKDVMVWAVQPQAAQPTPSHRNEPLEVERCPREGRFARNITLSLCLSLQPRLCSIKI